MPPQSFSSNPDRTLNQLTNVAIDDLTLATGDVIFPSTASALTLEKWTGRFKWKFGHN